MSFALVHADLWGPCNITNVKGYKYFLVLVDDCTRVTWVYMLGQKSETPDVIKKFFAQIKTQFSTVIRIFRSDNGLEFMNSTLQSFFETLGLLHQTSCAHTSQQNGVAERKLRHLLDVARTIMFQMNVPSALWPDAVLTACYLINQVSSSIIGGKVPISLLCPEIDVFPIPARVFGCVCFVHQFQIDKLSPLSVKCVFVGYSRTQKGYRCYDSNTRRYYVSADVTFF